MGIFKKKFIWNPLLVFLMIFGMFGSSRRHYVVSNKHLVLGLRNFFVVISSLGFVASSYDYALFVNCTDVDISFFLYILT